MKKKEDKKKDNLIGKLGTQAVTVLFIFAILLFVLSSTDFKKENTISLSELSSKINSGLVKEIDVELDELKIKTSDGKDFIAKKEREASLTESLKNLGVKSNKLDEVKIKIEDPSSFAYYLAQ